MGQETNIPEDKIFEARNLIASAADNAKSDISQDLVFQVELSLSPLPELAAVGEWDVLENVRGFNGKMIQDRTMEQLKEKLNALGIKTYSALTHAFDKGVVVPINFLAIDF